jgi:hypothetical protein
VRIGGGLGFRLVASGRVRTTGDNDSGRNTSARMARFEAQEAPAADELRTRLRIANDPRADDRVHGLNRDSSSFGDRIAGRARRALIGEEDSGGAYYRITPTACQRAAVEIERRVSRPRQPLRFRLPHGARRSADRYGRRGASVCRIASAVSADSPRRLARSGRVDGRVRCIGRLVFQSRRLGHRVLRRC